MTAQLRTEKIERSAPLIYRAPPAPDWPGGVNEIALVSALCCGSETAFALLVEEHHATMVRVALLFVNGHAAAEDVVQDVWLIVLSGIHKFQGRSSLKTWIFHILTNRAKTASRREGRSIPMSITPAVEWGIAERSGQPEDQVLIEDALGIVHDAIRELPLNQQRVIVLRDVEGRGAKEVCRLLNLSEGNQRVILHRARAQVRQRLQSDHGRDACDEVA